ncbi:hypothetical protein D3C72_2152060 [compost metagenome]
MQAGFHRIHDVKARHATRIGALGARLAENLGRHHHVLARHFQVLQRLTCDDFGTAVRINVGGINEVDTGIERAADQRFRFALLQLADLPPHAFLAAKGHGAQAQLRDEQTGIAEFPVTHVKSSL